MSDVVRPGVADIFTFASIAAGVVALGATLAARVDIAGGLLLLAVLLDWLDGRVARKLGEVRRFGLYLDSVADVSTFGAIPAAIAIVLVGPSPLLLASAALFVCAGAYRLARFQVRHAPDAFEGVPITVNGIVVGGALLGLPPATFPLFFPIYFAVSALLMVSWFKVRKV